MKTIEEKARAYDSIIEKANKMHSENCEACKACIEELIPELKESEDEKVRKEIIDFLKLPHPQFVGKRDHEKWIAWLEKQEGCEHIKKDWLEHIKQSWYKEGFIDGKYSGGTSKEWTINDATTLSELIDFLENGTAKLQHDLTRYANWLKIQFTPIEKQGEQEKDILEDAILDGNEDGLIAETIRYKNEKQSKQKLDKVESKFKVGDWIINPRTGLIKHIKNVLLCDNNGNYEFESSSMSIDSVDNSFHLWTIQDAKDGDILTFKNNICGIIICKSPTDYDTRSYCRFVSDNFINKEESGWDSTLLVPATKEQRALLFQKMKEAGYEWDSEKKELNKFHVIDEGKAEMDYCFTKMMNNEKVSSAWSEEDTFKVQRICKYLDEAKKYYADITEVRECIDWLKSLRPQNHWKPSDEQISQLQTVIDTYGNKGIYDPILTELLFQLKKLKEE